jgi:hypothetical protein
VRSGAPLDELPQRGLERARRYPPILLGPVVFPRDLGFLRFPRFLQRPPLGELS